MAKRHAGLARGALGLARFASAISAKISEASALSPI